jgi:hypothetical protein
MIGAQMMRRVVLYSYTNEAHPKQWVLIEMRSPTLGLNRQVNNRSI